jgi:NADP-reducing hydrogenase subunit HndD
MPKIKINNIEIYADAGNTILEAAKDHNMNIPTLCHYPDLHINSDCRICSVEIVGQKGLVTACSTLVKEGMDIKVNSPRALNARRTITEMILANHDAHCTTCVRNMNCELQTLADNLGIDTTRYQNVLVTKPIDTSSHSLVRNPNRCIKCGRCIDVCKSVQSMSVLEILGRGRNSVVSPAYGKLISEVFCTMCGQCSSVCPVGAITEKDHTDEVWKALDDTSKHVIVQVAPAVRVSLGEELGLPLGTIVTGKLISALKMIGFSKIFDTNFTADLTVMEEGTELINRIKNNGVLPLITSCCPAWINFAEHEFPEILDNLSSCKSPQQMFGALAKSYYAKKENIDPKDIYVVSIMPCTAKKTEAKRPEMSINQKDPDVDAVLTTRELAKMIKQMGIDFNNLRESHFDKPDELTSGAAVIFGASGGVMEAALRTVKMILENKPLKNIDFEYFRGTEHMREADVEINGINYKLAIAHTLASAREIAEQIKAGKSPYSFIEIMACPGGCVGGGGQPYGTTHRKARERTQSIYQVDRLSKIRNAHDNPAVSNLYSSYLGHPGGHLAHELLHTHYSNKRNN